MGILEYLLRRTPYARRKEFYKRDNVFYLKKAIAQYSRNIKYCILPVVIVYPLGFYLGKSTETYKEVF